MEATLVSGSGCFQSFGQEQFGAAEFGDRRLTARAVITADALLARPQGSLPSKLSKAQLPGFYDFADNPKVCHEKLMNAHCQRTAEQVRAVPGTVPFIHDTIEADYSGLGSVADLGPIGNGGCRGLLVHHVLAVDYERKLALGLMGQITHRRRHVPKNESAKAKRRHPQRESRLWVKGVDRVGPAPLGRRWVNLMDRGGDSFESLQRQRQLGQSFVCRSKVDWYQCRPMVEELHKAEKTGCGMEQVQFTTRKALEVVIAMVAVVAVQLLRLRDLSRDEATASLPATAVVDGRQVQMLSLWRYKEVRDLSVKEFYYALAMLGGHLGRPRPARLDRPVARLDGTATIDTRRSTPRTQKKWLNLRRPAHAWCVRSRTLLNQCIQITASLARAGRPCSRRKNSDESLRLRTHRAWAGRHVTIEFVVVRPT
ncbi:MAG TPA: transposase DNA-binding-containing protein [Tepidisphaeraceae bacterium]|jgi:hypothetical protein|nr:transposase DNA-binding-containing protein [Tepidisphaeraceae bacterium]